jgi:hypothetical protein
VWTPLGMFCSKWTSTHRVLRERTAGEGFHDDATAVLGRLITLMEQDVDKFDNTPHAKLATLLHDLEGCRCHCTMRRCCS